MKKLYFLALALCCTSFLKAQDIVKIQPLEIQDSIIYQTKNAIISIDKVDLDAYLTSLDTVLKQRKYDPKTFKNIQFHKCTPQDIELHYKKTMAIWQDVKNNPLTYSNDVMMLFWMENERIVVPYLDEILPDLLAEGRVRVWEKLPRSQAPFIQIVIEVVQNKAYRVFKLKNGKDILRETDVFMEHFMHSKS
ncbi:hypothetical protein LX64_03543 [Chitinophaga skermanii]|uniref:GLPGLI family protein n=1 Tax=Chitinophaga skermanii TaxID=331697 RepID=A0A327QGR5_9BACT|nr:hypothetical protein [Chitinophaga skermanii]RAJ02523.1 hypothetical protein LX64_03543 [Chitinophaga skermanii]